MVPDTMFKFIFLKVTPEKWSRENFEKSYKALNGVSGPAQIPKQTLF
jgi:hypothetical protein